MATTRPALGGTSLSQPLLTAAHLQEASAPSAAAAKVGIEVYEPALTHTSALTARTTGTLSRRVHAISLLVNILLFGAKLYVYVRSQSMVVLAALVDSTVDLLAQAILLLTNRLATLVRASTLAHAVHALAHAVHAGSVSAAAPPRRCGRLPPPDRRACGAARASARRRASRRRSCSTRRAAPAPSPSA